MPKKKKPRKTARKRTLLLPLLIVLFLFASLSAAVYFIFLGPGTFQESQKSTATLSQKPSIVYEEPVTEPELPLIHPGAVKRKLLPKNQAFLAIVIDDIGYKKSTGSQLLDLDLPLSFAFLPFGPHTAPLLKKARQKNKAILLHMPMEALDSKWDPGPGALFTSMTRSEIQKRTEAALQSVQPVVGINNHMGSRLTADKDAMESCLAVVKEKNLFFLDSLTSSDSIAYNLAGEMGLKTMKRDLFLDNIQDKKEIMKQLDSLILLARKKGTAIGIGHPYQATLEALRESEGKLLEQVTVVGIHQLIEYAP
ncbi:MAG: divergent polysaccharide deacetylase family protein [Desulfobulbaceae bacterium]|uniref:Divergent polysaccharide deacetylase family protein n=1 Tax=Candidatus Desulfobia pelagia TaxID=2841692 RepID=A0A8J6NH69_9BACT|nr:divergent polysaccharide deacetylase family protein [Candidatus Desulfobia pelagia]